MHWGPPFAADYEMEEDTMYDNIIQTKDVSKKFKRTYAIKELSMSVRKNTVYGLLGPNGAGKSTLLKMITGIIRPTSGQILLIIIRGPDRICEISAL